MGNPNHMDPLKKLAAAVLVHALIDAQKGSPKATEWLLEDDSSFVFWCGVYGVDPSAARQGLRKAMKARPAKELRQERITQALMENPQLSNRELGRRLGCNYEAVRQVRLSMV